MTSKARFRDAVEKCRYKRFEIEEAPFAEKDTFYGVIRDDANELIESATTLLPELPSIHFDFVFDGRPNAFATKNKDEYFIAVSTGLVYYSMIVLQRILAHKRTFPNVGCPERERDDLPEVSWDSLDAERMYLQGVRPLRPLDDMRNFYAQHLLKQFSLFVVGHELAHITRGHVDFVRQELGVSFISELGLERSDGEEETSLILQALEFDADRRTVRARSCSMFESVTSDPTPLPWSSSGVAMSVESMQFDWAFAANVMFRIFGDRTFTKEDLRRCTTHPPMPLRRRMAMQYAQYLLRRNWTDDEIVEQLLQNAVKTTEEGFELIGAPSQKGGLVSAYSDSSNEYLFRVAEQSERIYTAVKMYAFEEL